jgi:hypothetical protein
MKKLLNSKFYTSRKRFIDIIIYVMYILFRMLPLRPYA